MFLEFVIRHLANGGARFGDDFAVATVRAKDIIVFIEQVGLPHGKRLPVRWKGVQVPGCCTRGPRYWLMCFHREQHFLKFSNQAHVRARYLESPQSCNSLFSSSMLFVVLADRDVVETKLLPPDGRLSVI